MDQFELQAPPELLYSLNRLLRTLRKYHSRMFLNNLKSSVLRSLLTQQSRPQSFQQEQSLEMQYVGMCAEKIQAVFKGYMVRKYHIKAVARLNRLREKWSAVVLGWKTRQIFRCCKIVEEAKVIRSKRQQLKRQEEKVKACPSQYSIRKQEYLRRSLKDQIQQFTFRLNHLLHTQAWVFQPKISTRTTHQLPKKKTITTTTITTTTPTTTPTIKQKQIKEPTIEPPNLLQLGTKKQEGQIKKPTRVREMRQRVNRNNKLSEPQEKINNVHTRESTQAVSSLEDRPIMAKGAYVLEENMMSTAHEQLKSVTSEKVQSVAQEKAQSAGLEKKEDDEDRSRTKKVDRTRMEKRQKYDPKKAIEEEKKRKKMQKQLTTFESTVQPEKTGGQAKEEGPKSKEQVGEKEGKSVEQQEETTTRSTVLYPKAPKSKVEPKIDCWAHRKTNHPIPEEQRTTYRSIHSKEPEINKNIQRMKKTDKSPTKGAFHLPNDEEERAERTEEDRERGRERERERQRERQRQRERERERERQKQRQRQRQSEKEREKQRERVRQRERQRQRQKEKGTSWQEGNSSTSKREGHKCIEEIESVYNNVYQGRLQRLLPKLSLLAAAREKESFGEIPVVSHESSLLKRKLSQNSFNSRFWWTASRLEKTFKEFDLS